LSWTFEIFPNPSNWTHDEGKIIVGITERSIFGIFLDFSGFLGIKWNYLELFLEFLENLHKIPLTFLELFWNSIGIIWDY
jgi:hypothetical protein